MVRFGVLALQGNFQEHIQVLQQLGVTTEEVRQPSHLAGLEGLILPGGESTTIGKLAAEYRLLEPLRAMAADGIPMWGTCAGLILLARNVECDQPLIGKLDVSVQRNAFGRQIDSFETNLLVPALTEPQRPFPAVFIRAPVITSVGPDVEVLARLDDAGDETDRIVAVQQGCLLATAFHPELTDDDRFHRHFLALAQR